MRFLLFLSALLISSVGFSCTGIQLTAKDGTHINGRTVEFGAPLDLAGLVIPRQYEFKGTLPDGSTGLVYRSKYAAVGGNAFGAPAIVDGINEKGLSIGMFYFPGYADYAAVTAENKARALSPVDFPNWVITQFASVAEVKAALQSVVVVATTPKGWPGVPPFHYVVYDKEGNSLVIEPVNGELHTYENPLGVLTNSPTFNWHTTNLSNYINLTPVNAPGVTVDGLKIKQFGEGSGLHGMPGDFTPPSRFIRAAIFASTAIPSANAEQAVFQAFHILNQFDIPVGAVRSMSGNTEIPESTLATTVKDPSRLLYYFKTYDDQTIKVISLNKFDLNGKTLKTIPMKGSQTALDVSGTAK
jgi:choloylglycine hydrolase